MNTDTHQTSRIIMQNITQDWLDSLISRFDEKCSELNLSAKVEGVMSFEAFRRKIIDYFLFPNMATCFDFNDLIYACCCEDVLDIITIDATEKGTNCIKTAVSQLCEKHSGLTMEVCLLSIPIEEFVSFRDYYRNCAEEYYQHYLETDLMLEIHSPISPSANKVAALATFNR